MRKPITISPTAPLYAHLPYTTLFRSVAVHPVGELQLIASPCDGPPDANARALGSHHRSEEHTSELQSHVNLVCRLLLEKKKPSRDDISCTAVITDNEHRDVNSDAYTT